MGEDTREDPVMGRITTAIEASQGGDREGARASFAEIWAQIGPDGDPLHRCTLAHHMADTQDDARDELDWDLRALAAADSVTDERAKQYHATLAIRGFYPSLHLNVADACRRIGDEAKAREHLALAREHLDALGDDGYATMIRAALDRLETRLNGTGDPSTGQGPS